jgi:hypothetical protein
MTKQISVTGINTTTEQIIVCDIMNLYDIPSLQRRIESCVDSGADKVVIVLPCGAVFDRNVKTLNAISLSAFANQIFRTLGAE